MKKTILFLIFLTSIIKTQQFDVENLSISDQKLFKEFREKFQKKYSSNDEFIFRFKIFRKNLRLLKKEPEFKAPDGTVLLGSSWDPNQKLPDYQKGINEFIDLTDNEFHDSYLLPEDILYRESSAQRRGLPPVQSYSGRFLQEIDPLKGLPKKLDWKEKGKVTPVKFQSRCNSCYAFSANSALEAHFLIQNDEKISLSEQEILDCSTKNYACKGGQPSAAFEYVVDNFLAYDKDYPYIGKKNVKCYKDYDEIPDFKKKTKKKVEKKEKEEKKEEKEKEGRTLQEKKIDEEELMDTLIDLENPLFNFQGFPSKKKIKKNKKEKNKDKKKEDKKKKDKKKEEKNSNNENQSAKNNILPDQLGINLNKDTINNSNEKNWQDLSTNNNSGYQYNLSYETPNNQYQNPYNQYSITNTKTNNSYQNYSNQNKNQNNYNQYNQYQNPYNQYQNTYNQYQNQNQNNQYQNSNNYNQYNQNQNIYNQYDNEFGQDEFSQNQYNQNSQNQYNQKSQNQYDQNIQNQYNQNRKNRKNRQNQYNQNLYNQNQYGQNQNNQINNANQYNSNFYNQNQVPVKPNNQNQKIKNETVKKNEDPKEKEIKNENKDIDKDKNLNQDIYNNYNKYNDFSNNFDDDFGYDDFNSEYSNTKPPKNNNNYYNDFNNNQNVEKNYNNNYYNTNQVKPKDNQKVNPNFNPNYNQNSNNNLNPNYNKNLNPNTNVNPNYNQNLDSNTNSNYNQNQNTNPNNNTNTNPTSNTNNQNYNQNPKNKPPNPNSTQKPIDNNVNPNINIKPPTPVQQKKRKKFKKLKAYQFINQNIIDLLKAVQKGPLVVAHFASNEFKFYSKGIYNGDGCQKIKTVNHATLLVGYDLNADIPFMLFKNSWGKLWGDEGYYKMAIGDLLYTNKGLCLVAGTPFNTIPILE